MRTALVLPFVVVPALGFGHTDVNDSALYTGVNDCETCICANDPGIEFDLSNKKCCVSQGADPNTWDAGCGGIALIICKDECVLPNTVGNMPDMAKLPHLMGRDIKAGRGAICGRYTMMDNMGDVAECEDGLFCHQPDPSSDVRICTTLGGALYNFADADEDGFLADMTLDNPHDHAFGFASVTPLTPDQLNKLDARVAHRLGVTKTVMAMKLDDTVTRKQGGSQPYWYTPNYWGQQPTPQPTLGWWEQPQPSQPVSVCVDEPDNTCLGQQQPGWEQQTCIYAAYFCVSRQWGAEAGRCCPATCNTCSTVPGPSPSSGVVVGNYPLADCNQAQTNAACMPLSDAQVDQEISKLDQNGVKFLCWDWDLTANTYHTYGKTYESMNQINNGISQNFVSVANKWCSLGRPQAVCTYSNAQTNNRIGTRFVPGTTMIANSLEAVLDGECGSRQSFPVYGRNDHSKNRAGKTWHLGQALQNAKGSYSKAQTMLVDDTKDNIDIALDQNYQTTFVTPATGYNAVTNPINQRPSSGNSGSWR